MMWRVLATGLVAVVTLAGCAGPSGPIRVGAKAFDEQRILAQVLMGVAERQGLRARLVECGDTYGCHRALREGEVDLMVEYTGTAMRLTGVDASDPQAAMGRVRELYRDLGLEWMQPLGFDNAYTVVVPTTRAAALGLTEIGDLARLEGGIRVAAPGDYVRRPADGLFPLVRRYGLRLAEPPLLRDDPGARFQALQESRADAAVAYATDGALAGRRLRVLADPLDFFPSYEGAVVARQGVLERHPQLADALQRLEGRIDTPTMQGLNARVQLEGESPARVAEELLRQLGFGEPAATRTASRAELLLVRADGDRLAAETTQALRIADAAFPEHTVRAGTVADPVSALADGGARLAVLGAERFFQPAASGEPRRDERAEAVVVLGTRMLHLVRRRGDQRAGLKGRVGALPSGSGAAAVTETLFALADVSPAMRGEPRELLEALSRGRLDAALILAEAPDPEMAEVLAREPGLTLRPLSDWLGTARATRLPFLRAVRIPAGSYAHQAEPVETLGAEVVLAGAAAQPGRSTHVVGPAGAVRTAGLPLNRDEVAALSDAAGAEEMPDPLLPSPWSLRRPGESRTRGALQAETVDTLLNIAVWVFIAWLLALLMQRRPR